MPFLRLIRVESVFTQIRCLVCFLLSSHLNGVLVAQCVREVGPVCLVIEKMSLASIFHRIIYSTSASLCAEGNKWGSKGCRCSWAPLTIGWSPLKVTIVERPFCDLCDRPSRQTDISPPCSPKPNRKKSHCSFKVKISSWQIACMLFRTNLDVSLAAFGDKIDPPTTLEASVYWALSLTINIGACTKCIKPLLLSRYCSWYKKGDEQNLAHTTWCSVCIECSYYAKQFKMHFPLSGKKWNSDV